MVWSKSDKVSILEMLFVDCEGDSMFSVESSDSNIQMTGENYRA